MLRKLVIFGEIGPPLFSASPLFPASDANLTYILPNILLGGLRILICANGGSEIKKLCEKGGLTCKLLRMPGTRPPHS